MAGPRTTLFTSEISFEYLGQLLLLPFLLPSPRPMDYDRNDALLHWIFRQTQGDSWFRPNEEAVSSGVALRVSDAAHGGPPEFRVFPYENASLEPFETAVAKLNPVVAVKVRSAAVHAALSEACVSLLLQSPNDADTLY